MILIVAQQKRIKNADYYEFGCHTVDGHEGNELASNENDSKWLEKAEKVITVKATKKRKVVTQRTSGDTYKNQQQKPQKYTYTSASQASDTRFIGSTTSIAAGKTTQDARTLLQLPRDGVLAISCYKLLRQYPLSSVHSLKC